jgi:hypothetical protein
MDLRRANREGTAKAIVDHLTAAEAADTAGDENDAKWHRAEAAKLQLQATPRPTLLAIDWSAFWARERTGSFLSDPLVPRGRQINVVAPAKLGKSELALWTAMRVATGRDLYGNRIDPVPVLYLDFEMSEEDLEERLLDFGVGPDTDLSHLIYALHAPLPPLDTARGGEALTDEITAVGAELVVIDTLARVVEGEENAADTYLSFARHTGNRLRALGVAGLYLDHTGKDLSKGARGSSAKNDHADAVFRLTRGDQGAVRLELTHSRVGWLESITLRRHEDERGVRYEVEPRSHSWPAGTAAAAARLDALAAPLDVTADEAQRVLRDADSGVRRKTLLNALRYRREGGNPPGNRPDQQQAGTVPGTTEQFPYGTRAEPPREPPGTAPAGDSGLGFHPYGGNPPTPDPSEPHTWPDPPEEKEL